jgi:hypothetical protein
MSNNSHLPNLQSLVRERLTSLGASHLPVAAMDAIERDALLACRRAVARAVTAPRIGRAVAAALAAPAAKEQGLKGAQAPLTSSPVARNARKDVAGLTYSNEETAANQDAPGGVVQPIKEVT